MRTFLHHFREHHTTEVRCLWNNSDVFGDGPEEQPQSSEHQETTDATNAPEGVRVRIETAEEMETSVQEEALKRMESADTESKKEEDLQTKLNREIGVLLESIKGLSSSEQGARVREFNEKFLHPLGHHLYLIDGNARMSTYAPEDPRMAIYRAKIAELTAEISRTTTAINQARIHGIAPMAREYRGFKRGMMRRGNIAPEIQKFMMQFPATGASALAPDLKKMYEHLAKKQMELAQLKQAGPQSMPLPAPAPSPTHATPIREESAPRFQRRVPVDRMEFSRSLSALDPETQEQIRSLSPEFQQAIGGIASSLDEQEKADLRSLTEKLANGDFNAKINAPIFNPDGTLRTAQEIRTEIASHPMETETLEAIARFIDSLSPGEKQVMQIIIRQAQRLNEWKEDDRSSAEQIARYTDAWMKAKESGDEAGIEIAEGLLLMQGVEIDDKGKITPLEDNFGGKGMGFIMGLILVVDGFLKKIGEKMERKKKGEKHDETPDAEMTAEKKTEEMKKSEKKIEDLKKEQKDLKEKIQKGEEELAKEPPETKHVLQIKIDNLRKELKELEIKIEEEKKRAKELRETKPMAPIETPPVTPSTTPAPVAPTPSTPATTPPVTPSTTPAPVAPTPSTPATTPPVTPSTRPDPVAPTPTPSTPATTPRPTSHKKESPASILTERKQNAVALNNMPQTIEVKGVKYEVSFQGSTITVNKKVWKLQGKGKASLATFTINSAILQPDGSLKITVFVDKPFLAPDITKQETLPANKVAEMLEHFAKQKNPQTMTVQDSGETHQLEFTLSA